MITEYGMSDKIGPTQFNGSSSSEVFLGRDIHSDKNYSETIAYEIDKETQNFINTCYERAKKILTEHRDKLELIAEKLLEVETLDARQIKSLFEKGVMPEEVEDEEKDHQEETEKTDSVTQTTSDDVKVNITSKKDDDVTPDSFEESKAKKDAQDAKKER